MSVGGCDKFYMSGHLGDIVYTLYTVSQFSKQAEYTIDSYMEESPGWAIDVINHIIPLIRYQSYIKECGVVHNRVIEDAHNFDLARKRFDKNHFYEFTCISETRNFHLKKTYYVDYVLRHGGKAHDILNGMNYGVAWIDAPKTHDIDIVVHMPMHKMTRSVQEWLDTFNSLSDQGYSVVIIGTYDLNFPDGNGKWKKVVPENLLVAADMINSCKVFVGHASSCYVIAEALNKIRLCDIFDDASETKPRDERGWETTRWPIQIVLDRIKALVDAQR